MEGEHLANDAPLSLSEGIAALTKTEAPEPPEGKPEPKETEEPEADDEGQEQASDEDDADGEEDGEPGDEDQAEDGDDEDPDSDQGRFVSDTAKVKLADGRVVSIAELKQGSLLMPDYTRKTQEVAEQRRALETQSSAYQQKQQQAEELIEYATSVIQAIVPPEPDPALHQTDPMGYMSQEIARKQWLKHIESLGEDRQRIEQERQAEARTKADERARQEFEALVGKVPELKDQKRLERFVSEIKEHAPTYGLTPQDLAALPQNHSYMIILKDAIAWRKLQAQKPKVQAKVEGRPPVQRGGKRLSPGHHKVRETQAAMERLNREPTLKNGVAALLALESKR